MRLTLFIGAGIILSSCAWFRTSEPVAEVATPPLHEAKIEIPPQVPRELGSLWSENSKWNEFYSNRKERKLGDIIILYPSDKFKLSLGKAKKSNPTDTPTATDRRASQLMARITEVLPQGIYSVSVNQSFKFADAKRELSFTGKIREADIAIDDSSSTDYILDPDLQVSEEGLEKDKQDERNARIVSASVPGSIILPKRAEKKEDPQKPKEVEK